MVTAAMKLRDARSLEKKSMTNPGTILKSRDITLPTKVHLVKAINNLRYADDTTLMAESKEELKSLLMKVKDESEKVKA